MSETIQTVPILLILAALFACSADDQPSSNPAAESDQSAEQTRSELIQPSNWWDVLPREGYANLEKVGEYQDWFQVFKLQDDTFAIYEPYQFEEALSYLVLGTERGVLVDSGNGIGDIASVVAELTTLPVSALLTHEHHDHSGGANGFAEFSLYDNAEAIEYLRAGLDNVSARKWVSGDFIWKSLPPGVDPDTWHLPPKKPTTLLSDGQIIDLGDRRLEVIYTPGHSPGSASFLDLDNRLLFTGDHFYPGPLYAHNEYTDIDQYIASFERIADRIDEYDYVLGGHNEPWIAGEVIPRVTDAFRGITEGRGEFSEDGILRRYHFRGFDIIVRAEIASN